MTPLVVQQAGTKRYSSNHCNISVAPLQLDSMAQLAPPQQTLLTDKIVELDWGVRIAYTEKGLFHLLSVGYRASIFGGALSKTTSDDHGIRSGTANKRVLQVIPFDRYTRIQ